MHSSSFDIESGNGRDGGDVLVAIATLVTEGRIPGEPNAKGRGFYEGPHCAILAKNPASPHNCNPTDELCQKYESVKSEVLNLWQKGIPLCVEVLLTDLCACKDEENATTSSSSSSSICGNDDLLMEQWFFSVTQNRLSDVSALFNIDQLVNAVRSQLYFSQISAWLSSGRENGAPRISDKNLKYRLTVPGETYDRSEFSSAAATRHDFPTTDLSNGLNLKVSLLSLPRMPGPPPQMHCRSMLDDRMHTNCTLKGKHRCEDLDELEVKKDLHLKHKRVCCGKKIGGGCSSAEKAPKLDYKFSHEDLQGAIGVSKDDDLSGERQNRGDVLLNAILRSCRLQDATTSPPTAKCDVKCVQKLGERKKAPQSVSDTNSDKNANKSDIFNIKKKVDIYVDSDCDSRQPTQAKRSGGQPRIRDISNLERSLRIRQKITFDDFKVPNPVGRKPATPEDLGEKTSTTVVEIPSPVEQAEFRKSLDSAASMVFHSRTGLPLTSSPAPVRRGKSCFDFDSSINSVSAIKSALFSASFSTDDDSESDGSIVSPCSPETYVYPKKQPSPVKHYRRGHSANLLGSFEESVLNGRLEPVSTVHGFKAELGASGSFVPRHLVVPVTVFFYTLGDNDKVSSPYLGHINLGRKGYNVPKSGTVQVTLFNPLGTVVKMFVVMYDLTDMPPNSRTFIRQRTLYMPTDCPREDESPEWGPKWLRYLIHLRFMSSKSGRVYLHSDIRMIIFRKSDMDTATAHGLDMCYELRSFTRMPANPKYSPRK